MQLQHGLHLAYCTNIHRGETWEEVFVNLQTHVLEVRRRVCPDHPYAIGLRLGERAVCDLSEPGRLARFRAWLEANQCYVFTINGFPYGSFHGQRVKEEVYRPDWSQPERLDYTQRLFDLLGSLLPDGLEGGVSTVPGSFKEFVRSEAPLQAMVKHLWRCIDHLDRLRTRTGKMLHLDLEPEPLCLLETTDEVVRFFDRMHNDRPGDARLLEYLRVNYDTCHLAVEFEDPRQALDRLHQHRIRVGKFHLSSALKLQPSPQALHALHSFADPVYLHQVVTRQPDGALRRFRDLPEALSQAEERCSPNEEWRIHYHIPLHARPSDLWDTTTDHLLGILDSLAEHPERCHHLEMETYTWDVLPPELASRTVVDQLAGEYAWTLRQLAERNLVLRPPASQG